jgi:hypothetical protein
MLVDKFLEVLVNLTQLHIQMDAGKPFIIFVQRNHTSHHALEVLWVFVSDGLIGMEASAGTTNLVERVLRGDNTEALSSATTKRRTAWARQYLDAILARDVRDVASIEKIDHLPRFLQAQAQTAGQMCIHPACRPSGPLWQDCSQIRRCF